MPTTLSPEQLEEEESNSQLPAEDVPDFYKEREGLSNADPKDNQAADKSSDPREGGESGSNDAESLYTKLSDHGRFSIRGRITKKKALFGGGLIGTIIAVIFILFSLGPLQLVHIAQMMDRFHFLHQENAGDDRMGKLYRFARSGGNAGETRLGYLGSKLHANMLADLEAIGLKPIYEGGLGNYTGFEIDRSTPGSPFKDMSNDEVKAALKQRGVNISEVKFDGAKATVTVKGYINGRKSVKFLTEEMGNSKVPGAIRVRVMSRYGLVSWHPLKRLDIKINEKLAILYDKWSKAREERLKTGQASGYSDATKASKTEPGPPDENGNSTETTTPDPGDNVDSSSKFKDVFGSIKNSRSLKIGGALSTAVGAVCLVRSVNENIGAIRWAQVIAPLMRIGMEAVTVGYQIMNGEDVSSTEVSFVSKNFSDGQKTWAQAKPILAHQGVTGGTDITQNNDGSPNADGISAKEAIGQGAPGWISWAGAPSLGALCSGIGSFVTTAVGLVVSIFSAGVAQTAGGLVAGFLLGPLVVEKLAAFLSGESVHVLAKGALWGNYVDYGNRLGANSMSVMQGGTALSSGQESELSAVENGESQAEFHKENIASRLFDANDQRSAVSKLIDNVSPNPAQNLNKVATAFLSAGRIFSNLPRLFTPVAHAVPAASYDYGFPAYGFSLADLQNPVVEDPYANADSAAQILDGPDGQIYFDRAQKCFGVVIKKIPYPGDDGTPRWDVIPQDGAMPANPYDPAYSDKTCTDAGNKDWLRIRFFILDTGITEGYACYNEDVQSCANDGMDTGTSPATNTGTTPTDGTAPPTGNAQQLAQQILSNSNIDISGRLVREDIQAAADGKPGTAGVMTSSAILALIAAVGQSHKVTISAIQSGGTGHSTGSYHYSGDAVDFAALDGVALSGRDAGSLAIIKIAATVLPSGSGFGQSQCGSNSTIPSGFITFSDTCNHLHVQVPKGTP